MKIFVGYDPKEDLAFKVCKYSIEKRCKGAEVIPLKLSELTERGLYTRESNHMSSTEYAFSRFLVPALMNYTGVAVYCDADTLFRINIEELFAQVKTQYAVSVVHHTYNPEPGVKYNGGKQTSYPRKYWSSVVIWNCDHPSNKRLTVEEVNSKPGLFLHQFKWLDDKEIGVMNREYHWIVGYHKEPVDGTPRVLHYTHGGPWDESRESTEYGALWEREKIEYLESIKQPPPPKLYDHIPPEINDLFKKILKYRVDPQGEVYGTTLEDIIKGATMLDNKNAVAVDGGRDPDNSKGVGWDPYMESFILGSGGSITNYDKVSEIMTPVVFRGITKHKHMKVCLEKGRDFYYIDTGYFGNVRKKFYHRITKNAMQNVGPVIERPFDRLGEIGWRPTKFRKGRNILICPPSGKAMSAFGLDLEQWMSDTISTIKEHTDRPIVIRQKLSRRERTSTDTMEMALQQDVHCLVTFNSIAATEAVLLGKPAFALGPNAAHAVSSNDLTQIETPYIPSLDEVEAWAAHLAYCQFSEAEMREGLAWKILNDQ